LHHVVVQGAAIQGMGMELSSLSPWLKML
jgi:hypothetical protein